MNHIFYTLKHKGPDGKIYFTNTFSNLLGTRMCGTGKIYKVYVRETKKDEVSPYWGWYSNEDKNYSMIWPRKFQLDMCFPYGPEVEEEAGKGIRTNLYIEEIEELKE